VEVASRIAEFEPERRMVLRSLSGPPFPGTWLFNPEGLGTRLDYEARMELRGPARLFEPLIGRQFKRQLDTNFERLARMVDEELPSVP
jgi:hypothetical protein